MPLAYMCLWIHPIDNSLSQHFLLSISNFNFSWFPPWYSLLLGADNQKKVSHLLELQELGDLKIFRADLTDELSFEAPIAGCDFVFHVATPVHFASEDPEVWT